MAKNVNKLPNDYFPHDFNARQDRKILRLRKVLGVEGYGIYWMLIETLTTEENFSYPMSDIDLLADNFGTSKEKVEAVIKQFNLFSIDKEAKFFSLSLIARMQKYLDISEKARQNVNKRWDNARKLKEMDTPVLPPHKEGNTIKEKDIKGKDIKIAFEKFWELYDKKIDRKKCEPKWNRLSLTDQEKALAYIPGYKVAQPDKQFRKDPATFLNNYSWLNEIVSKTPVVVPFTSRVINNDWKIPLREAEEKIKKQGKFGNPNK